MTMRKKIAVAVTAGLAAGLLVAGVAFAAPTSVGVRLAVGALTPAVQTTAERYAPGLSWQDMLDFMNKYRTPDGTIDMYRMMGDVTSGRVAAPCGAGYGIRKSAAPKTTAPKTATPTPRPEASVQPRDRVTPYGYGMMGGYGGGMMGRYGGGMMGGYSGGMMGAYPAQ